MFLFVDQSSPIYSSNVAGVEGVVAVDVVLFQFSTRRSFTEIIAIKVERCQKSRRNLDVF